MFLMTLGHVLRKRRVLPLCSASCMRGYPLALVKNLHGCWRVANFDFLMHESVGNAVVVRSHFNVVVNVHPGYFELGDFEVIFRKRFQRTTS